MTLLQHGSSDDDRDIELSQGAICCVQIRVLVVVWSWSPVSMPYLSLEYMYIMYSTGPVSRYLAYCN